MSYCHLVLLWDKDSLVHRTEKNEYSASFLCHSPSRDHPTHRRPWGYCHGLNPLCPSKVSSLGEEMSTEAFVQSFPWSVFVTTWRDTRAAVAGIHSKLISYEHFLLVDKTQAIFPISFSYLSIRIKWFMSQSPLCNLENPTVLAESCTIREFSAYIGRRWMPTGWNVFNIKLQ